MRAAVFHGAGGVRRADVPDPAGGGIDRARHVTGVVPLEAIVLRGFVALTEQRAERVKIQVQPGCVSPGRRRAPREGAMAK